jgi:hypothetical protein
MHNQDNDTPRPDGPRVSHLSATARRTIATLSVEASDLARPLAARRGVKPHAADLLSRMERRFTYLPI